MPNFTPDQLNAVLNRGFKGEPFPIVPVVVNRVSDPTPYYQAVSTPQNLLNLGTCSDISSGLYVIDQDLWSTDEITTEDYYNTFNSINCTVTGSFVEIKYMHDFNTQLPPRTGNSFTDEVHLGPTTLKKMGNVYLTFVYSNYDNRLHFAICYEMLVNISVIPVDPIATNVIEFISDTTWGDNLPWLYLYEQGDPDWYDVESQVPDLPEGGGGGGFYRPSDTIGFSGLPSLDILSFGIVHMYKLGSTDAQGLSAFLWSDSFYDNIIKNWQSPFDNIISLAFVPLNAEIPVTSGTISIGNVSTGVTSAKISSSLIEKDFGSINFKELYCNFADYAPYTKLKIYLPMVGVRDINPDDYMDGRCYLKCYIDIFTGTCVYQLLSQRHGRQHVVDHYQGSIRTEIPITGRNFIDAYKAVINSAASIASGNVTGTMSSLLDIKPTYQKSGSVSGSAARLSVKVPYVFFDTPQLRQGTNFRQLHGYVSNTHQKLGDCTGFVSVKYIDLSGLNAPEAVKDSILNKLYKGIHIH